MSGMYCRIGGVTTIAFDEDRGFQTYFGSFGTLANLNYLSILSYATEQFFRAAATDSFRTYSMT